MDKCLACDIEQIVRLARRPYRGAIAAVLLAVLTAQVPSRSMAAPTPLLRIIHVAKKAAAVFDNAPTHQVFVIGGSPWTNSGSDGLPLAYTLLDGKTGAVVKRLNPTGGPPIGVTSVQPSADGSGQLYLGTAGGLQPLEANGVLGAPIVPADTLYTPLNLSRPGWKPGQLTLGPFVGPVALDPHRSLAVLWAGAWGGAQGLTGVDARTLQSRYLWISETGNAQVQPPQGCCEVIPAPYPFVVDPAHGRLYTAAGTALTALDEVTGHVLGTLHSGWMLGVEAIPDTHLLLTLGAPTVTEPFDGFDPRTGEYGPMVGPSHMTSRVTLVDTQPFRVLRTLDFPAPSTLWGDAPCLGPCTSQPLAVDPGTDHVLLFSGSSSVLLLDARTGRLLHTTDVSTPPNGVTGSPYAVAVDPQLHRAYVICVDWTGSDGQLTVLDTRTGAVVATVSNVAMLSSVAVDPQDQTVFMAQAATGNVLMVPAGITGNHIAAGIAAGSDG